MLPNMVILDIDQTLLLLMTAGTKQSEIASSKSRANRKGKHVQNAC